MHLRRLTLTLLALALVGWAAAATGYMRASSLLFDGGLLLAIGGLGAAFASAALGRADSSRLHPAASSTASVSAKGLDDLPEDDLVPLTPVESGEATDAFPSTPTPSAAPAAPVRARLARLPAPPSAENAIELGPRSPARSPEPDSEPLDDFPFAVAASPPRAPAHDRPAARAERPMIAVAQGGATHTNGRARASNGHASTAAARSLDFDRLPLAGPILENPVRETAFTNEVVTRGVCSKCDTPIVLSARRPIRATCPVCGHSKILK